MKEDGDDMITHTKLIVSSKGTILWTDYLPNAILLMTGNNVFSAAGCEDGTIHVYSSAGRRYVFYSSDHPTSYPF